MKTPFLYITACLLAVFPLAAAEKPLVPLDQLFEDEVLAVGKDVKVTASQVESEWLALTAAMAARGQPMTQTREQVQLMLVDRLVGGQIMNARATDADRAKAKERATKALEELRQRSGGVESINRQLLVLGLSTQRFEQNLLERGIAEEVLEREVKAKIQISEEAMRQYFQTNSALFSKPESVRVNHILLSLRNPNTGQPVSAETEAVVRLLADDILKRAKAGEDFATMARAYSQDPKLAENQGVITVARGRSIAEFEDAAFALQQPGQFSGIVQSGFGLHIIKLLERIPPTNPTFEQVRDEVKTRLEAIEVEKRIPAYIEELKKEAGVKYQGAAAAAAAQKKQ
jgi:parvulin-like peptidyl-prolyl isomerase